MRGGPQKRSWKGPRRCRESSHVRGPDKISSGGPENEKRSWRPPRTSFTTSQFEDILLQPFCVASQDIFSEPLSRLLLRKYHKSKGDDSSAFRDDVLRFATTTPAIPVTVDTFVTHRRDTRPKATTILHFATTTRLIPVTLGTFEIRGQQASPTATTVLHLAATFRVQKSASLTLITY